MMKMWKSKTLILLHVMVVLILAQSALAALKQDFPIFNLPEEVPPENQDGRSIYRGPVNEDLYPAVDRTPPVTPSPPSYKPGNRPSLVTAGMARVQDGALIPTRPLVLRLSPEVKRTGWRSYIPQWKGFAPSSTQQMQKLLKDRMELEPVYTPGAVADASILSRAYYTVKLPGNGRDAEVLKMMQQKEKPFYAMGARGKMFYFDTKDGKSWTFTDQISQADRQAVSANLDKVGVQYKQAQAAEIAARTRIQRNMMARQQAARAAALAREGSASSPSWLQKVKGFFGSASEALRPVHV